MRFFRQQVCLGLAALWVGSFALATSPATGAPGCAPVLALLSSGQSAEEKYFWQKLLSPAATSWRVRFSGLWAEFDLLREQVPNFHSYFLGGIRPEETLGTLLERQRFDQNRLASLLHETLQNYVDGEVRKFSPDGRTNVRGIFSEEIAQVLHLAGQLHRFIGYLELYSRPEAEARGIAWDAGREKRWQKFLRACETKPENPLKELAYWGNATEHFWSVLTIAATRPQLQSLHRPLVQSPALFGRRPRELEPTLNSRPVAEWKKPVQMIWLEAGTKADRPEDRKWAWGTVINPGKVLTTDESCADHWDTLAFNVSHLRESARRLGLEVSQYVFLPAGLTRGAAQRLLDLGYNQTVGIVVDAPRLPRAVD